MNFYYRTLKTAGGIMRTRDLTERGLSRHYQRKLLSQGKLIQPRRGWIALPSIDRDLMFAVQHGVLLSCMTVAHRLGLWTTKKPGLHVAARSRNACHGKLGGATHWAAPVIRREPFALIDSIENSLVYVAGCQPREEAQAVWESALRKGLVARATLAGLHLGTTARALLDDCSEFSDSGLESFVSRRLRALRLKVTPQAWLYGHHVDFLVEGWLVVQLDGGHHEGEQRDSDNKHDALLKLQGYDVIRLSYRQVLHSWADSQHQIMLRLSQGRPQRPK